jgi:hypothetical protein
VATRRLTACGTADPELAWERYERISLWPTWSPQISRVRADQPRIAAGVEGVVVAPGGLALPFTVSHVDREAHTWSWTVRLGPVAMALSHEVHPEPGGSGTSALMAGPGPLLLAYAPLAWVALRRLVAGQRRPGPLRWALLRTSRRRRRAAPPR